MSDRFKPIQPAITMQLIENKRQRGRALYWAQMASLVAAILTLGGVVFALIYTPYGQAVPFGEGRRGELAQYSEVWVVIAFGVGFALFVNLAAKMIANSFGPSYFIDLDDPEIIRVYGELTKAERNRIIKQAQSVRPDFCAYEGPNALVIFGANTVLLPGGLAAWYNHNQLEAMRIAEERYGAEGELGHSPQLFRPIPPHASQTLKERQQALESEQARIYKIAGFVLVGLIFAWRFIEEKTELITLLAPAEIKERFGSMRVVNQMDLIPLWQCALVCAGLIVLIVLTKYIADKNQLRTKPPFYIDHSDPKAIRVYGDLTGENSSLAVKEVLGRMPYYRPLMTPEVPGRYGCELVLLLEDDPYLYR